MTQPYGRWSKKAWCAISRYGAVRAQRDAIAVGAASQLGDELDFLVAIRGPAGADVATFAEVVRDRAEPLCGLEQVPVGDLFTAQGVVGWAPRMC